MTSVPYPRFAFELWCSGCGDDICAQDAGLPLYPAQRLLWRVRGRVLMGLFGWWWWVK